MSDFFEEYGWLVQSMVGGSLGIRILLSNVLLQNSYFVEFIKFIVEGLM